MRTSAESSTLTSGSRGRSYGGGGSGSAGGLRPEGFRWSATFEWYTKARYSRSVDARAVVERELRAAHTVAAIRVRTGGDDGGGRVRDRHARRAGAACVDARPLRRADAVLDRDGAVAVDHVAGGRRRVVSHRGRVHPDGGRGRRRLPARHARLH